MPINHMVVVSQKLSDTNPDAVREVHRMLARRPRRRRPRRVSMPSEMRRSLELIIHYCAQQKLIPRAFTVDELFDDVTRAL